MFSTTDTIVAIATPPGRGGIGVVRLSGPDAHAVGRRLIAHDAPLEPRHATFTLVRLPASPLRGFGGTRNADTTNDIDHVVALYFPAPASYTGDDVVELSAHGSPVVLRAIVAAAIDRGARLAEPGEFTLRAFLNGRIDLTQAEAVADLIDAATPLQARAAFDQLQGTLTRAIGEIDAALFDLIARLEASVDFPEEGYHFVEAGELAAAMHRLIALAGKPNVGKSSVFNALAGASRAIVADAPGTTRDLVTEVVDLDGLRVTLIDTAGLRETGDAVEAEGVDRARQAQVVSDLTLFIVDRSQRLDPEDILQSTDNKRLIVANKADLPPAWRRDDTVEISAKTGEGLDALRTRIAQALDAEPLADRPELTNVRHIALVQRAHDALGRARAAALADGGSLSEEFVLADLQDARAALEEIAGRRAPDDLLAHIFARFCVGK